MSKNGDVVWASGVSWQRDSDLAIQGNKKWWYTPFGAPDGTGEWAFLSDLKKFGDFRWLVKNGEDCSHVDAEAWNSWVARLQTEVAALRRDLALVENERKEANGRTATAVVKVGWLQHRINEASHALTSAQEVLEENTQLRTEVDRLQDQNMNQRQSILSYQESIKELSNQLEEARVQRDSQRVTSTAPGNMSQLPCDLECCPDCLGDDCCAWGIASERAAIVRWLRSEPYPFEIDDKEGSDYAAAIERGNHLIGE